MQKFILFSLMSLLQLASYSQISDSLYVLLPKDLKPTDKDHLSTSEKREILKRSALFPNVRADLEKLATSLEQEIKHSGRDARIKNFMALTCYYNSKGIMDKILAYSDSTILLIHKDTGYRKLLADAFINKGQVLVYWHREEATAHLYNEALSIYTTLHDSIAIGNLHNFQMVLYSSLCLFEPAINEARLGFNYLYPSLRKNTFRDYIFCNFHVETANIYLDLYETSRNKRYADSAEKHIATITNLPGKQSATWLAYCYFLKGCHAFLDSNFTEAIACLDSSLSFRLAENDHATMLNPIKKIYKGICLMELNKSEEGRKMILDNLNDEVDINTHAILSHHLYLDAQKRGDWKEALKWFVCCSKDEDSVNVITQRGKVFEVNQKYRVKEQEAEITNLELANLNQKEQKTIFILSASALVLVLIVIIAGLYSLSRRRKIRSLQIQQALENEQRKVKDLIISQDRKMLTEKSKAISELRHTISRDMHDGLSSALTNLKYYINNKRLKEPEEKNKEVLKDVEEELNSIYIQVREYMHNLNQDLDKVVQDFGDFLISLSEHFSDPDRFYVDLQVNISELKTRLNAAQQNEMNMIIKEAVTNTMKHASATKLVLAINFDEKNCSFNIADNGAGFVIALTEKGLGLESIKARVQQLRGSMVIESLSSGTSLKGSFPLAA